MNGAIIIDKPAGWTSHDVVNRMRRILGQRSIGHLGTLDPMATGVLPLVVGSFTRLAQFYSKSDKSYEGTIRFGFATDTYDADGEQGGETSPVQLELEILQSLASQFVGLIEQVPPPFSAKKINGVPAYKLARKHKEVVLAPVPVEIKEFVILGAQSDRASFRARVSSGTYMRSIAHEMGKRLGGGAHLASLRRTAVAEFHIDGARSIAECEEAAAHGSSAELFVHPRKLLPQLPSVTADEAAATRIRSGRPVNLPELSRARQVKVFEDQTELIAIATRVAGSLFHPRIVLSAEQARERMVRRG